MNSLKKIVLLPWSVKLCLLLFASANLYYIFRPNYSLLAFSEPQNVYSLITSKFIINVGILASFYIGLTDKPCKILLLNILLVWFIVVLLNNISMIYSFEGGTNDFFIEFTVKRLVWNILIPIIGIILFITTNIRNFCKQSDTVSSKKYYDELKEKKRHKKAEIEGTS